MPKPSLNPAPIRRLTARLRLPGLAGLAALLLASCAGPYQYAQQAGQTRVHPRVARAQARPIQGIDVSKYQGKIDWASVRSAGTHFAFIKATEGGSLVDERFIENWHGAKQAGVARGAYHFMFWCRSADEQAAWFKRTVPNDPDALPPVLDLEWNAQSRTCPRRFPREEALGMIRVILHEMEAHTGKRPIIYTDITFHRDVLEGELSNYPHWVRSVAAEPQERYANRPWLMWQYTAAGRLPGIQTDVDLNAFYGSSADWAKFLPPPAIRAPLLRARATARRPALSHRTHRRLGPNVCRHQADRAAAAATVSVDIEPGPAATATSGSRSHLDRPRMHGRVAIAHAPSPGLQAARFSHIPRVSLALERTTRSTLHGALHELSASPRARSRVPPPPCRLREQPPNRISPQPSTYPVLDHGSDELAGHVAQ